MTTSFKALAPMAAAIGALAVALVVSGPAWADGYRHHRHDGGDRGSYVMLGSGLKHLGHYGFKKHRYSHDNSGKHRHVRKHHARKHRYEHSFKHHGGDDHVRKGYVKRNSGCHPVSKVRWDRGRKARFGGTLCYDAYGNGFIVPGSRYLIGYLY